MPGQAFYALISTSFPLKSGVLFLTMDVGNRIERTFPTENYLRELARHFQASKGRPTVPIRSKADKSVRFDKHVCIHEHPASDLKMHVDFKMIMINNLLLYSL